MANIHIHSDRSFREKMAEQAMTRSLRESTETFGLSDKTPHLIAKLRILQSTDPQLLALIRGKGTPWA